MTIRQYGGLQPAVFARGTRSKVFMSMPPGETIDERIDNMFRAGCQLAQSGDLGDLVQVIYVCEGWMGAAKTPMVMPSQDPNRQEALVFSMIDVNTHTQSIEIYVCVRDARQSVIDLKRVPLPEGASVESPLLPAFVAGFRLFKR
jgi:hypothetical protein